MKPIQLKLNLEHEIYFPVNVLFVLSEMQRESPCAYNVIQGFVEQLKKEREKLG